METIEKDIREKAIHRRSMWLLENGFNIEGYSYVYIANDSYKRKEELKAAGWRYNNLIGWHNAELNVPCEEKDIYKLTLDESVEFNADGYGFWKATIRTKISDLKESLKQPSRSEWIGIEKDKIYDIPVILSKISNCDTRYGYTNIYTFLNGENIIVWFTSTILAIEEEKKYLLSATIKSHKEYKNEKQTIITRAKIKEII